MQHVKQLNEFVNEQKTVNWTKSQLTPNYEQINTIDQNCANGFRTSTDLTFGEAKRVLPFFVCIGAIEYVYFFFSLFFCNISEFSSFFFAHSFRSTSIILDEFPELLSYTLPGRGDNLAGMAVVSGNSLCLDAVLARGVSPDYPNDGTIPFFIFFFGKHFFFFFFSSSPLLCIHLVNRHFFAAHVFSKIKRPIFHRVIFFFCGYLCKIGARFFFRLIFFLLRCRRWRNCRSFGGNDRTSGARRNS